MCLCSFAMAIFFEIPCINLKKIIFKEESNSMLNGSIKALNGSVKTSNDSVKAMNGSIENVKENIDGSSSKID